MNLEDLRRLLRPLSTRISNLIGRGVIKRADDSKKVQELQAEFLPGEVRDEIERFGAYGFTSVPKAGAEGIFICVGGRRDQVFCIGTEDRRYRPTDLADGEVAIYNDTGAKIVFKTNGDIEVTPKSGQKLKLVGDLRITGSVTATGDIDADGTVTGTTDVVGGGKSLKTHTHSFTDATPGGPVVSETLGPS